MHLELVPASGSDVQALCTRRGVTLAAAPHHEQLVRLTAEAHVVDALLYDLIGHGWSIRSVISVAPGQPPGSS
jgi:hypothetical protein